MSIIEIFLGIALIILAVTGIAVVLFQEGNQRNLGAITGGGGDTFLSKNKSRSIDVFLERWTRNISIGFFIFVIVANIITFFHLFGA